MKIGSLIFFSFVTLLSGYVILVVTGKLNINPIAQLNNTTQEHFIYSIGELIIPFVIFLIFIGIIVYIIKR